MTSKNVQRLTADGVLETVETPRGRRYDWDKTVEMYVAYLSDKANGREKKETTAELEEAKLRAEVDIKEAKAKAAQMELKELQGKMHRAEDVEAIKGIYGHGVRLEVRAVPNERSQDVMELLKKCKLA